MKKQNKIIIGVIIGIAAVILIVSFFFPSVYKGLTSGSFGKADKYHQEQMTQADIQLRSDFTKDTAQLRQMVTGLIYFALFTDNLSMTIDTCLVSYSLQGFDKDPANSQAINLLKDYNTFLKNNTKTLANTTRMLAGFLLQDTASGAVDVENNLRDFANYVNQVNQKDSVLMIALAKVDSYLVGNKTLQKKNEEIRNLKAIRDQLLIKSTQFMALTNNKQALGSMLSYSLQSQSQFSGIGALKVVMDGSQVVQSKIGVVEIPAKVLSSNLSATFNASSSLQSTLSSQVNSAGNLSGNVVTTDGAKSNLNVILYDKANLNFVVGSAENLKVVYGKENLNGILCGTDPNLGALCVFYGKNLAVTLNAGLLANLSSSPTLSAALSAATLNVIIPAKELSAVNANFNAIGISAPLQMGYCGSKPFLSAINANVGLQSCMNANGMYSGFSSLQATSIGSLPQP